MKIRNGFVSNSSSSSFVVAFPEKPTSVEHIREMMFKDEKSFPNPYPWDDREKEFSTLKISETVCNDISNQTANDIENIVEGFGGWLEGSPENPDVWHREDLTQEEKDKIWNDWDKSYDKYQRDTAMKFIESHKDMFIYVFEYSDNDGDYFCTLEHGGIFDNLQHVKISRH